MFRHFPTTRAFIGLILLAQSQFSIFADIIVMKNGERLEAKITKTTDTTVEADVKISAAITDSRVIQKSEILGIDKPDPAETALEAAKAFGPGPNSLTPALYNAAIHTHLTPFLAQFPNSAQADAIKQMIAALEAEKARVIQGDVKVENEWYTPVELEKQKPQVSAMLLLQQMKALAQAGDRIGALNTFGQIEKLYPGCKAFPLAVDFANQLIPSVQREIDAKKIVVQNDLAERQKGLSLVPPHLQGPLIAAAALEDEKIEASIAAAQKAGNKWTPIYPRNAKSVEALQTVTTAEATRLAAIQTGPMLASLTCVREAKAQMAAGNTEGATASLQKATTLWGANLLIKDVTDALTTAKTDPSPAVGASPTPTAPSPSPEATSTAAVPAPVPTTAPASQPSATPAAPTSIPPAPVTAPELPKTASAAVEKRPFLTTIPGAVAVLGIAAIIAGGISWTLKAKGNRAVEKL